MSVETLSGGGGYSNFMPVQIPEAHGPELTAIYKSFIQHFQCCLTARMCSDWPENSGLDEQ